MIDSFSGEFRFLSNFAASRVEIEIEGRKIIAPTVEHAYQALKAVHPSYRIAILNASSPGNAKGLGKKAECRADWEAVKLGFMETLVRAKFQQNPKLAAKLLATGDAELIEGNWWGDRFWGVCRGQGENHLGKILMKVRDELREEAVGDAVVAESEGESAAEDDSCETEVTTPLSSSADSAPQFVGPWAKLDQWLERTSIHSLPGPMMADPLYREVLKLPLIVEELIGRMENGDFHWQFLCVLQWHLNFNPVPPSEQGKLDKVVHRWTQWYRNREKPSFWAALAEEGLAPVGCEIRELDSASAPEQETSQEGGEREGAAGEDEQVHSHSDGAAG
jgi:ribA/ribD-fused uncharacterized protein